MKNDCFAYKSGECRALSECVCKNAECRFYKTAIENIEGRSKAEKRIRSLDPGIVRHISDTYYKSKL